MIVNWNPLTYHALASPHREWAAEVVRRLPMKGSDLVLDAGCGTGYLTSLVAERTTSGSVIGVDLCLPMLQFGLRNGELADPRISVLNADLLSLPLFQAVDGIFSNAVFHWILDQASLFAGLFSCLRPGGWLVAQAGGGPNMRSVLQDVADLQGVAPFAHFFRDWKEPWVFVGCEEMKQTLSAAGFAAIEVWLEPRPVTFLTSGEYSQYLREIVLRPHLERLPIMFRDAFLGELARRSYARSKRFEIDYCRINISARRA